MPSLHNPSRLSVMFDDDHAVANAGLALVGVLSEKLGLEQLAEETVSIAFEVQGTNYEIPQEK